MRTGSSFYTSGFNSQQRLDYRGKISTNNLKHLDEKIGNRCRCTGSWSGQGLHCLQCNSCFLRGSMNYLTVLVVID